MDTILNLGLESIIEDYENTSSVGKYGVEYQAYGNEALMDIGDSDKIGYSLESMYSGVRFTNLAIRDIMGDNAKDVLSMEGMGDKIKEAFGKTKDFLVKAYKKLIEALKNMGNHVRVFFSSATFKSQASLYAKLEKKFAEKWAEGSKKEINLPPKGNVGNLSKLVSDDILTIVGDIQSAGSDLSKDGNDMSKIDALKKKWAEEYKGLTASDIAKKAFYGESESEKLKSKKQKISDVFERKEFQNLKGGNVDKAFEKDSFKALKDLIKEAEKGLKESQKTADHKSDKSEALIAMRSMVSRSSQVIFAAFSMYLTYRANLTRAFKTVAGAKAEGGNDDEGDEE